MKNLMFDARFIEPIRAGTKRQTIRPRRKVPIQIGETISLRHWEGAGYRSPQIEIKQVKIVAIFPVLVASDGVRIGDSDTDWLNTTELDEFCRGDGFENWTDMLDYFRREGYGLPFSGDLYQWAEP